MKPYHSIINSFYNGQLKQMAEQIVEMTEADFLVELEADRETMAEEHKVELLIEYLRVKNR